MKGLSRIFEPILQSNYESESNYGVKKRDSLSSVLTKQFVKKEKPHDTDTDSVSNDGGTPYNKSQILNP